MHSHPVLSCGMLRTRAAGHDPPRDLNVSHFSNAPARFGFCRLSSIQLLHHVEPRNREEPGGNGLLGEWMFVLR